MAINRRGWVLLVLASGGFAASLALVWPRHAHAPTSDPAGSAGGAGGKDATDASADGKADAARIRIASKEHSALCERHESDYRKLVTDDAAGCQHDDDCVSEERGGIYAHLDGCARFRSKTMTFASADAVAAQWLADACAWPSTANADCGATETQCQAGHCVERPPAPLPRDWKRLTLPGTLSVFAPPDFVETDVRGEDSFVRVFQGRKRSLSMEVDSYAGPYDDMADSGAQRQGLDGETAWVYRTDTKTPGDRRFEDGVLFARRINEPFLGGGYLSMRLYCADTAACGDFDAIVRSVRVLSQPVDIHRDH